VRRVRRDNVRVAGVKFRLDGDCARVPRTPQGPFPWPGDTRTVADDTHADGSRSDAAGKRRLELDRPPALPVTTARMSPTAPVASCGFDEGAGETAADGSGNGNTRCRVTDGDVF